VQARRLPVGFSAGAITLAQEGDRHDQHFLDERWNGVDDSKRSRSSGALVICLAAPKAAPQDRTQPETLWQLLFRSRPVF
jgi:hypothetical protein